VSNILRSIAEWLSLGLDYIVLISVAASLGSLAFAVVQVRRKKKAIELQALLQLDLEALHTISGQAPFVPSLSSMAAQRAELMNVGETGFAQRISGQERERGPERALSSAGPMKGFYGTGSYSQR
jgi:hypothetical protein